MNEFDLHIHDSLPRGLLAAEVAALQINLGRTCNLACGHCHLECSPDRGEQMPARVMEHILSLTGQHSFHHIDLTGGSPELHPRFRYFVEALCAQGHTVQIRTNLAVLLEPSSQDMAGFFKAAGATLIGSLPCYLPDNVDAQRGKGVHAGSIAALRLLNREGYGLEEGLTLNLVYNPGGPSLPPPQSSLEAAYRKELKVRYGISFSHLLVMTNVPLGRFRQRLEKEGQLNAYLSLLRGAFNPATLPRLMCRHQLSVDWDGTLYDCDFNLAMGMPVNHGAPRVITALNSLELAHRRIMTGNYCFACTAGAGSSCSGVLTEPDST